MALTKTTNIAPPPLVLSLFPGIDLLGRGFEEEGYCVVRGPDLLWGGDVRRFHVPRGRFDGVIAGSPCQDFSIARRSIPPTGYGLEMLAEFRRIVAESGTSWWWLENVPGVPIVRIPGYSWLRIDLDARDFGARQRRLRHFQWGHVAGLVPCIVRSVTARARAAIAPSPTCTATEGARRDRRTWADFCADQGIEPLELPPFTLRARYAAVGNGVHVAVARAIAAATREARPPGLRLCLCGCARVPAGGRVLATPACRKRVQRRRDAAGVPKGGRVTRDDLFAALDPGVTGLVAPIGAESRPGDSPAIAAGSSVT